MKAIDDFIHHLFKKQKKTTETEETIRILIEMLTEKVEDLKEQGYEENEAIDKTINEFGELDDFYHPNMDKEKKRYKRQKTIEHYRNDLLFSTISSAIIIGILAFVNIEYFLDAGLWFIIPSLGILFWPLSLLYKLLNKKGDK
ncbi:MAG: hypothetical protein ACOCU2_01455 [Bacillota bacterium]